MILNDYRYSELNVLVIWKNLLMEEVLITQILYKSITNDCYFYEIKHHRNLKSRYNYRIK